MSSISATATNEGCFSAIVLAAGQSLRFGPTNKLVALLDGKTVLGCVLDTLELLGLHELVVVLGPSDPEVEQTVQGRPVKVIRNANFAEGMGTSIAAGARALGKCDGVFIVLGDMPFLAPQDYRALMRLFSGPHDICRPRYHGQAAHPVLFGETYFSALTRLSGDAGAKQLLVSHADHLAYLDSESTAVVTDIDRPDDLA